MKLMQMKLSWQASESKHLLGQGLYAPLHIHVLDTPVPVTEIHTLIQCYNAYQLRRLQTVISFSKLNQSFSGYFDPVNIRYDNKNK